MKVTFLLITIFWVFPSFSQTALFSDSCNTVLWGIVNAKGDTSYLLGTCHIVGNTFVDGYAPINRKYQQATCIVGESTDNRFFSQKNIWFKKLPVKDQRLIKSYLKQTTPSFYLMSCLKLPPSFLYYLMLGEMAVRECHTYNENDVCDMDAYLMNRAATFNKEVRGLEQRDSLYDTAVFSETGVKSNEASIEKIIDFVTNNDRYKDTVRKWANCEERSDYLNLKINYRFSKLSVDEDSSNNIVCDQRNDLWMPALKKIIDSEKAFIAVGIGHLYYKKGLIIQLTNSGYKVFPVAMHNIGSVTYSKKRKHRSYHRNH